MTLPREELLEVVRRTSVMAHRNSPLRLRFAEGEVTVWTQTQDVGEARETLPIRFEGEPLEIGFNAEFLRDGIESADGRRAPAALDRSSAARLDPGAERRLLVPDHADPLGRLIVATLSLVDFRSYARLELALEPGLVLAVGPNGAGKTNLLESLHVATQGFSPRTRSDAELIRFGETAARIQVAGTRNETQARIAVGLSRGEGKRAELNGARLRAAEQLRERDGDARVHTRPPGDREGRPRRRAAPTSTGRWDGLYPSRSGLPADYAAVLAQRNAALKRGHRDAIRPWTEQAATLGAELVAARTELLELLASAVRPGRCRSRPPRRTLGLRGRPADRRLARGASRA